MGISQMGKSTDEAADIELPAGLIATVFFGSALVFSTIGALFLLRTTYSILRFILELTVIPGTDVSETPSLPEGAPAD